MSRRIYSQTSRHSNYSLELTMWAARDQTDIWRNGWQVCWECCQCWDVRSHIDCFSGPRAPWPVRHRVPGGGPQQGGFRLQRVDTGERLDRACARWGVRTAQQDSLLVLTKCLTRSEPPPRGSVRPGEVGEAGGHDVVGLRQAGPPASHLPG